MKKGIFLAFIMIIECGHASGMMHEGHYLLQEKKADRASDEPKPSLRALSVAFLMIATPSYKLPQEPSDVSSSVPYRINTFLKHIQKCSWNMATKNPRL